jgi:enamine deaminase RidA (YjgF/YER057c/UK114 family)
MREAISVPGSLPDRPFSPGLRDGSLLVISGQVAVDEDWQTVGVGDFATQVRQVFVNVGRVLTSADLTFANVAELTYYLVDLDDFPVLDKVRRDFLVGPPFPASTAVEVSRLLDPDWLLEVSAIAVVPDDGRHLTSMSG